ncbi:two component LuxR family transcriptional regulator [Sporocytophaga myxococcoides]|uniref:Two component LuxR family transcriptional regulator n=1 Tax=Sporocytophaga myxococcoides TaxID=153721 RepID=A0A098LH48_9BACT|nr:response regulator transcription factor [Sporocytophaga myxococcoides]GAL85503.1 two component LuxR family transcriptional regulator [Sporocytophaga myxococcoides]
MSKIKLILADDHSLIRAGFRTLLGKNEAFEIVGEATDGQDLVKMAHTIEHDVILTDITMPGQGGLDAMEQLKKENPYFKFIVLTMHEEREYVLRAIKIGAQGYLLKNIENAELAKAIKTVYDGGKYFSPFVVNLLAENYGKPEALETSEVTPREKEVLQFVAKGFSTKQIADELGISIRTVESHRINMLKKLRVSNSAELIKKAIKLNLID